MKRIISMISALLLTASLWSCNSKNPPVPEVQKNTQESIKSGQAASETSYKLTSYFDSVRLTDEDKIKGDIINIKAGADKIFIISDCSDVFRENDDEEITVLCRETDPETMQSTERTEKLSAFEGNDDFCWIKNDDNLKDIEEIKDLKNVDFCYGELEASTGDHYYIISEKYSSPYLLKTDSSGKTVYVSEQIYDIEEGYQVFGMSEAPDGRIIIASYEFRGLVTVINPETGSVEEVTEIPDITAIHGFAGSYLVCSDNDTVYGYSFEDADRITIDSADEGLCITKTEVINGKVTVYYTESPKRKYAFYCMDTDGKIINSTETDGADDKYIGNTFVSNSGDLYCEYYGYGVDSEDGIGFEYTKPDIYRFSSGSFEKIYDAPVLHFESYTSAFFGDKNGNIFLCRDDRDDEGVFSNLTEVYSSTGELLFSEKTDSFIRYYITGSKVYAEIDNEPEFREIVFENGELKYSKTDYKTISDSWEDTIIPGTEKYDFCIADKDRNISGYSLEEGIREEIMSWSDCDEELSENIIVLDNDTILARAYDFSDMDNPDYEYSYPETYPVLLRRADEQRLAELNSRKIITAAGYSESLPYSFRNDVKAFNRDSSEYMIHFKNYKYDYDSDIFHNPLSMDIINGFTPDILIYSSSDDMQSLVSMNVFADFKEIMDGDDTLNYDDILPSAVKLCTQNSCMYRLFPSFRIFSLAAKESLAGSDSGWKFSDVNRILSENPDSSFDNSRTEYKIYEFLSVYLSENVDYENRKCSFDTEEFRELLKLAGTPGSEKEYDEYYEYSEDEYVPTGTKFKNNTNITYEYEPECESIEALSIYADEKAVIKGYPSSSGKPYLLVLPDCCFSVMKSSEVKDGAWKFISRYFTDEYQKEQTWSVLKKYTENGELYAHERNREMYGLDYDYIWTEDREIPVPEPDEKTREHIRSYMASDMAEYICSSGIMNIVYEETEKYFSGEQDEDTTAANVQKKVQLYLSERE